MKNGSRQGFLSFGSAVWCVETTDTNDPRAGLSFNHREVRIVATHYQQTATFAGAQMRRVDERGNSKILRR
jgi:hypothetical protein